MGRSLEIDVLESAPLNLGVLTQHQPAGAVADEVDVFGRSADALHLAPQKLSGTGQALVIGILKGEDPDLRAGWFGSETRHQRQIDSIARLHPVDADDDSFTGGNTA